MAKRRLQVVIELYQRQEKQALEQLGLRQQQLQQIQAKLESLVQYRDEYAQQNRLQQGARMAAHQLHEYQLFLDKLDQAIVDQKQLVQQKKQEVNQYRQQWQKQHQKTESLQKLDDKALAEILRQLERAEQTEQDCRSARGGKQNGTGNAW